MKVVFVGGRQADILCQAYRALAGGEDVVWLDASRQLSRPQEDELASADVMALQATGMPLGVDLDEIETKGERLWFPELCLDFLWPFGGQPHFANTWDDLFPVGPFPIELGDAYLNRRLQGRERLDAIMESYQTLDIAKIIDLDAYKRMVLERQAKVDAACGSEFALMFEREFRDRPLFANPLTPGLDLMRMLAEPLFARLPARRAPPQDWRLDAAATLEAPIHPSVAAHFGLTWTKDRLHRSWTEERIDFVEYLRRYLAYAEGPELETGVKLAANGVSDEALDRLERALARPIGAASISARRAIARAFATSSRNDPSAMPEAMRSLNGEAGENELTQAVTHLALGRAREAQTLALAFLEQAPASVEALLLLARIREKLGDVEGRIDALRQAVAHRAGDPMLHSQLTLALASKGDWREAAASAENEVALNPENPHARAFLSAMFERIGDTERAKQQLERALEIITVGPQYAALRNELSKRRTQMGATQEVGSRQ